MNLLFPSLALIFGASSVAAPARGRDDGVQDRELTSIAEEQALLRRQVQRLRSTMELLLGRIEAEGRTQTAALLREGLKVIDERAAAGEGAPLTLDERMESSRDSIDKGQVVQALERQEELIAALERLLSVLMDRKNLESLEENIDELRELQTGLQELIGEENRLKTDTEELRERASSKEQRALQQELERLIEAQSKELAQNEAQGRASGTMEMELLERELSELTRDQRTDSAVLSAWDPADEQALKRALDELQAARAGSARAERLETAAETLRSTADEIEVSSPEDSGSRPWADDLSAAAERAERDARAAGDPAASAAAEALRKAAEAVRAADLATAGREQRVATAGTLRELADELAGKAQAARAPAQAAQQRAAQELGALAERDTAGGAAAEEALAPLQEAAETAERGDAQAAARALARAERDLRESRDTHGQLGQALARSQAEAAERAERIDRGLSTLPAREGAAGEQASAALKEAAQAMQEAAQAARQEDAEPAAERAAAALAALERAAAALGEARASAGEDAAQSARQGAAAQSGLAQETRELQPAVERGSLSEVAEQSVAEALERAAEAMERAASELSEGRSASAAGSQREAREALQRAAEAAREGVTPRTPEDRARAEELAREQERIREKILDLARRAEERKNAKPLPSLDRASTSAGEAGEALEQGELSEAEQSEEETQRELERALEELKQEEEAYQRLRQEEVLFRIAEEATQMLSTHREQMAAVREIDAEREPGDAPSRSVRLRLRNVAREEEALGTRAGELAEAIAAEGSEVTAELMRGVADDLARINRALGQEGDHDTGERVQARQRDVEEDLTWLIEALKQEQRRREEEQQQQQQQPPPPENRQALVPDEAELKLLRRMEVEVQEAVDEMLIRYPELADPSAVDPLVLEDILRVAGRHERITQLFTSFRRRLMIPDEPAPEEEGK